VRKRGRKEREKLGKREEKIIERVGEREGERRWIRERETQRKREEGGQICVLPQCSPACKG